ncbi:Ig-like domain-containing protein, partial [Inhella gelatinilytica]
MPVITKHTGTIVLGLQGKAFIRRVDGSMELLKLGDVVHKGDVILTSQDGLVELSEPRMVAVAAAPAAKIDPVLAGDGELTFEAPAAGAPGAGGTPGGEVAPQVRLDRVNEVVNPASTGGTSGSGTTGSGTAGGAGTEGNAPPTGADDRLTLVEDGSVGLAAIVFGFADADVGQTLQAVRIDTLPGAGTLLLSGVAVTAGQVIAADQLGNLVFIPAADANGTDYASFQFSVQDSQGVFSTTPNTLTFDVTAVADRAIIGEATPGAASGSTQEDIRIGTGGTLTVVDPDAGEAAFVAQTVVGEHGTFTISATGVWTYNLNNADPAVQALGLGESLPAEGFTVTTIDGTSTTIRVSIAGSNDGPMAQAAGLTSNEDAAVVSGRVNATDGDTSAILTYSLTSAAPAGLSFNADGSYSFDPSVSAYQALGAGETRVLSIPFAVTDDHGAQSTALLTITVIGTNDAPVAAPGTGVTGEDQPLSGRLPTASDAEGNPLVYGKASDPSHGTVVVNADGSYVYTPSPNYNGPDSFTYTVSDGQGGSNTYTVNVTVSPVNDAPVAANAAVTTNEDTAVNGTLPTGSDVDGDAVSYAKASDPAHGTVTVNANGSYVYTPVANYNGPDSFTYTVSDGQGGSNTYTVNVTVSPVNDAPVAANAAV